MTHWCSSIGSMNYAPPTPHSKTPFSTLEVSGSAPFSSPPSQPLLDSSRSLQKLRCRPNSSNPWRFLSGLVPSSPPSSPSCSFRCYYSSLAISNTPSSAPPKRGNNYFNPKQKPPLHSSIFTFLNDPLFLCLLCMNFSTLYYLLIDCFFLLNMYSKYNIFDE